MADFIKKTSIEKMRVNLFILGACKSGTSYLHDLLSHNEHVCGSIPKEPYYFELPIAERKDYISSNFQHYKGEKFLLDGRHRSMFFSWIPKEIIDYNPIAKSIIILRNPVDRAFSHWWMWYSRGIIKENFKKTICKQILAFNKSSSPLFFHNSNEYMEKSVIKSYKGRLAYADADTIIDSGYYSLMIENVFRYFKQNDVLFIDFERLNDFEYIANEIKQFIQIDLIPISTGNQKVNSANAYRKNEFQKLHFLPSGLKNWLKVTFLKKPRVSSNIENRLNKFYYHSNTSLIENYQIDFVRKWQNLK